MEEQPGPRRVVRWWLLLPCVVLMLAAAGVLLTTTGAVVAAHPAYLVSLVVALLAGSVGVVLAVRRRAAP